MKHPTLSATTVRLIACLTVASVLSTALCPRADAGGYRIPDQSTRAMSMMDAFNAGADDASAVYYNPAGLTHLDRPEFIGNLYVSDREFSYDGPFGDESSDTDLTVFPTVFVGGPLPEAKGFFWGLGVYAPDRKSVV